MPYFALIIMFYHVKCWREKNTGKKNNRKKRRGFDVTPTCKSMRIYREERERDKWA